MTHQLQRGPVPETKSCAADLSCLDARSRSRTSGHRQFSLALFCHANSDEFNSKVEVEAWKWPRFGLPAFSPF